ncbi:hypothetical protein [Nocardia sp. NPDC004722]
MPESLPSTAVVRVGRASFDPAGFEEFNALITKQGDYLIPAIEELPGILHWFTGVSPEGSTVQVSIWDTEEHAKQMDTLKKMAVVARGEMEAIGGIFERPIINYPINWTIEPTAREPLPSTAVIHVARGSFDPSRFAEVDALATKQADYLVPAIKALPGLLHWFTAVSPVGSIVNISIWDTDEHAKQMMTLTEMVDTARGEFKALDALTFAPIVDYPIDWTI